MFQMTFLCVFIFSVSNHTLVLSESSSLEYCQSFKQFCTAWLRKLHPQLKNSQHYWIPDVLKCFFLKNIKLVTRYRLVRKFKRPVNFSLHSLSRNCAIYVIFTVISRNESRGSGFSFHVSKNFSLDIRNTVRLNLKSS